MPELSKVPITDLLQEVLSRKDELVTEDGLLWREPYDLADFLGTRICVDGIPIRRNQQREIELMAIRRNTGPYVGKLCSVGGGVDQRIRHMNEWIPESFEEALRRHFRVDLGFEIEPVTNWEDPQFLAQEMRPVDGKVKEGFGPNPSSRHLVAARFLVRIIDEEKSPTYGATELGGQEVAGLEWFTRETMPELAEFGYGLGKTYQDMFPIAERLS